MQGALRVAQGPFRFESRIMPDGPTYFPERPSSQASSLPR